MLAGQAPDHPPVSFWHHFTPQQRTGQAAVDAHVAHVERFNLDFLKVMNDHHYARGDVAIVQTVDDLKRISPLPGDAEEFAGQLEVLRQLRQRFGNDVLMTTTLFSPWTVLRLMTAPPSDKHGPPKLDPALAQDARDETISRLLAEDRSAVKAAVAALGRTLANFARACVEAGADGVFLSVRDDWVDTKRNGQGTYDEIARDADLTVLAAVADARFNWLHICGRPVNFKRFAEYPHVAVLNWADRAAGPSIAYARDRVQPAIAGGVDNLGTLPLGTPEQVTAEVRDAIRQAKNRPIIITPGCTYDPTAVPEANLYAMISACR